MTNEEILKNNRLIAEFMGLIPATKNSGVLNWDKLYVDNNGILVSITQLDYHKSWDKLMPVAEKIESLGYFCMINKWTSVYTGTEGERIEVTTVQGKTKILNTWKAVTEFIIWYNENKQH